MHTFLLIKIDNQQEPTVQQRTLLNAIWQTGWKGSLGENEYHLHVWLSPCAIHLEPLNTVNQLHPKTKLKV